MFGVIPDLATLAKAVGGGFPVAVYGGKAEIMDLMADGTVFRAGTLNANRVAMAAAYAALDFLSENNLTTAILYNLAQSFILISETGSLRGGSLKRLIIGGMQ